MTGKISRLGFVFTFLVLIFAYSAQAEDGYKLGAGDVVRITVYGQPDLTNELRIDENGEIDLPLVGPVLLGQSSVASASKRIAAGYQHKGILTNAHVNIFVTEYRSQAIVVLGYVNQPGRLYLQGPTRLTDVIAWAGGVKTEGSHRIILTRPNAEGGLSRFQYDIQKLLGIESDNSEIPQVQGGDTIYIPVADRFYVRGEVNTPGVYSLDRPLNVMQAVSMAGGLSYRASKNSLTIFRKQKDGTLKTIEAKPNEKILDGDVLQVGKSLF